MKQGIVTRAAWWKQVTIACGLALLVAGCGSGGSASSGGTSSSAPAPSKTASPAASPANSALCADAAALRASLDKLAHVKVGAGTVNQLMADLNDVKAALTAFVTEARGQWRDQTNSLSSALDQFKTAVSNLAANPSTTAASKVVTALGGVNAAARNLLAAVDTRCPSASPSV